jgi:hypothetical protein
VNTFPPIFAKEKLSNTLGRSMIKKFMDKAGYSF